MSALLQAAGFNVIANVRVSGRNSIPWALAGAPHGSTVAIGLHGTVKSRDNRQHVIEEIGLICDNCRPTDLVVYGSGAHNVLDYPLALGIRVHLFKPDAWNRSADRRAG